MIESKASIVEVFQSVNFTEDQAKHFWDRVFKTDSCWLWLSFKDDNGYGRFSHYKPPTGLAHRIAWMLVVGPLLKDMELCHDCPGGDNPSCVNPAHLFVGTHADNFADAARKGMMASGDRNGLRLHPEAVPQGMKRANVKLTDIQVVELRSLRDQGMKLKDLAVRFNISPQVASGVANRKAWKHIP